VKTPQTPSLSGRTPTAAHNRRDFLKRSALLPLCATLGTSLFAAEPTAATSPAAEKRKLGSKLKLSLNAFSFNELLRNHAEGKKPGMLLFELLEYCAEHDIEAVDATGYYFPGYPTIPSDAFINDFKRRAFQLGIDISGTGIRNDFAVPDAAKRAFDVQLSKAWIEVAAKMGAPVIRLFAGAIPRGYEEKWKEPAQWVIECLQECAEHGKRHGVLIGVQNHGDMLRNAEETLYVLKRVASDWVGVIVDTGNMMTPDPYKDIAEVAPYAVNWQIKESAHGNKSAVLTDLPKLIRIIKDSGYRGYIPIETLVGTATAQGKPYEPYTRVAEFAAAVRAAM
jgi:sugar phosphate isomerase/epimerase